MASILGRTSSQVFIQVYAHVIADSGQYDADLMAQWVTSYEAEHRAQSAPDVAGADTGG